MSEPRAAIAIDRVLHVVAAPALMLVFASMSGGAAGASAEARLPMTFAHADHRAQNCIRCHHEFVDKSGQGLCLDCHLRDVKIRPLLETQFHSLCRGCHVEQRRLGNDAGPARRCFDCHHEDDQP